MPSRGKPSTTGLFKSAPPLSKRMALTLRVMNGVMAGFHGLFALVVAFADTDWNLRVPVYHTENTWNESPSETESFLIPSYKNAGSLYLTQLTFSFFLLSCLFHLGAATLWYKPYIYCIEQKICPFRWAEYFFSASIMYAAIAYTCGLMSVESLMLGLALISTTMLFGVVTELLARPLSESVWNYHLWIRLLPHVFGYVPQVSAWVVLLYVFVMSTTTEMPAFVYGIVISELILFFSFGGVQLYQQLRPPSMYVYGEIAYQVLSLVSKGLLGIILMVNVLFLSNFACAFNSELEGCE